MGSLLRLASLNWSGSAAQFHPARVADHPFGCLRVELHHHLFPRLTGPTYILPWYSPILPQPSTRLAALAVSVARPAGPRKTRAEIGLRAGKIINHYKISTYCSLTMSYGNLAWARKVDAIQQKELLDGIYVIRTSAPAKRLKAADGARNWPWIATGATRWRLLEHRSRCASRRRRT